VRAPDEVHWGLPVWRYGDYEVIADLPQLQFVVMRGSVLCKVCFSLAEAERFIAQKEGR
jgi:hypothetical protein